jgi:hypothetical protein
VKGAQGGIISALGAIGVLIAVLLLVLRKGPFVALMILLMMALAVLVISVIQGFMRK